MIAPRRLLAVLAAAALAAPATAHAQGAGDDQYQDPFAAAPKTTKTPPASPTERAEVRQQQQPALSQQPPAGAPQAPSAAPAAPVGAAGSPLPYTGAEIPGMALMGLGLLAVGVGLRLRTADDTLY